MRTVLAPLVVAFGVLLASPAQAQFQNHSLGLRVGALWESSDLDPTNHDLNLLPALPAFGVNGSFYIENGFDFFAAIDFGIQRNTLNSQTFVIYPEVALRYFFEDYIKPYAGVQLSFVHAFLDTDSSGNSVAPTDNLIGVGGMGGLEYSITDQLSVGGSVELVALMWLNVPVYWEPRVFARISTNF